jgi:hypothetical protein
MQRPLTLRRLLAATLTALLLAGSLAALSAGCANQTAPSTDAPPTTVAAPGTAGPPANAPTDTSASTPAGEVRAVAENLWRARLDTYKTTSLSDRDRILDYRIEEIGVTEVTDRGFAFTVKFAVQIASPDSNWIAGNGVMGENGWMEHKFQFVRAERDGTGYKIVSTGTGP